MRFKNCRKCNAWLSARDPGRTTEGVCLHCYNGLRYWVEEFKPEVFLASPPPGVTSIFYTPEWEITVEEWLMAGAPG